MHCIDNGFSSLYNTAAVLSGNGRGFLGEGSVTCRIASGKARANTTRACSEKYASDSNAASA